MTPDDHHDPTIIPVFSGGDLCQHRRDQGGHRGHLFQSQPGRRDRMGMGDERWGYHGEIDVHIYIDTHTGYK